MNSENYLKNIFRGKKKTNFTRIKLQENAEKGNFEFKDFNMIDSPILEKFAHMQNIINDEKGGNQTFLYFTQIFLINKYL